MVKDGGGEKKRSSMGYLCRSEQVNYDRRQVMYSSEEIGYGGQQVFLVDSR